MFDVSFPAFETRIGDAQVRVALSGVGSENARHILGQALEFAPDVCICSGLAGSLKAGYHLGDIVVPVAVCDARSGRSLRFDMALLGAAVALGAKRAQMLLTTDEMILSPEQKRELGSIADTVDMESFASMEEVAARNIPGLVLRSISDGVDDSLPLDFSSILDERGGVRLWRLVGQIARAPHRLPALIRLGRRSRRAAELLANFLDSFVRNFALEVRTSVAPVEAT